MKKMKKSLICFVSIVITMVLFSSCKKANNDNTNGNTVADPSGTITTNLASWYMLYEGVATFPYVTQYASYPYIERIIGMDNSTLTTSFQIKLGGSGGGYINWDVEPSGASEVANIGAVNGLGNVTEKPSNGYTNNCSLEKGHGYVIRYKKSYDTPSDLTFYYARFYVVDWYTSSTTGGVVGAEIKLQSPF